jgi:O-antigen/teichoic acid export membrane protein
LLCNSNSAGAAGESQGLSVSRFEVSKKLVIINSASSAVVLVLNLTVLIWLQQYLLKRISPDEYALLPLVMAVMAFGPLLSIVLTGGLGRYITVAYARGDDDEITRICSTMFPLLLAGGGAVLSIGWFAAWHIDSLLKINPEYLGDARLMMVLLVFSAAIRLPLAAFGSGFIVRQKLMLQDMIDVGCQLVRIALLFTLLFVFGAKVMWVTVALVVSELLSLFISTPISVRLVPAQQFKAGIFSTTVARELMGYGLWGFIDRAAESIKQAMDPIILNRYSTSYDVSIFHLGGIVPRQLKQILVPFSRPFIPVLAALHATNDRVRLRSIYLRVARYHCWVLALFVVPGVVLKDEIFILYLGEQYLAAANVMAVLLVVTGLSGFNALGPAIVMACGDMRGIAQRMLLLQSVNFGLVLTLVAYLRVGAIGSAVAALITSIVVEVFVLWPYCRKVAGVSASSWVHEVVLPTVLPTLVMIGACVLMKNIFIANSWIVVIGIGAVSAILGVAIIGVACLREQDRRDLEILAKRAPFPVDAFLRRLF